MDFVKLLEIRHKYADVYVSQFDNDLVVPWRPLTLKQFADYCKDIQRNFIPPGILENEVFRACVVDRDIVDHMDELQAGIVTTVVQNILDMSGPRGPESFNEDLGQAREIVRGGQDAFIHEAVYLLTLAFPYKPEDIYAMDYPVLLQRLALAEYKLMETGILQQPINIVNKTGDKQEAFADLNPEPEKPKPRIDAKKLWEEQQAKKQGVRRVQQEIPREKWWKESPVLEAKKKHKINFGRDAEEAGLYLLDNHERNEPKVMREYLLDQKLAGKREQLLKDVDWIYPELVKKSK